MRYLLGKGHRQLYKIVFYLRHGHLGLLPHRLLHKDGQKVLASFSQLSAQQQAAIADRVNYYNRLTTAQSLSEVNGTNGEVGHFPKCKPTSYYYDLMALLRYFPERLAFSYEFGDVIDVPARPTFVKSRPINDDNAHSILLKLDSVRHFYLYPDKRQFEQKQAKLVWRGAAHQPHRLQFLQQFHAHPKLDVGCVHQQTQGNPYYRPFMRIAEQLRYRYILSIEGNDVATNLKWILASNSLCFMTRPKYETWLMEGRLQAGVHYVQLRDDYADLEEKIAFYDENPDVAKHIITNAHNYMRPFLDRRQELLVSLMVMDKYFRLIHTTLR